jgi:probable rRNA maturation factor
MTPGRARKSKAASRPARKTASKAAKLIEVMVQSPRWNKHPRAASVVRNAVRAAAEAVSTRPALAIVLTDDSAIRRLNREWRGFDKPTNVLSFPAAKSSTDVDNQSLGDVIIAFQTVAREARDENKLFNHHLAHLAVHGFLHLLGYDHETERDAHKMERLEVRILEALGMPDPYAEKLVMRSSRHA